MVKKRYTFYYIEFILGHYTSADDLKLIFLFKRMSNEEKLDIESGSFERMWVRVWRELPIESDHDMFMKYYKCKRKFENCFQASDKIRNDFRQGRNGTIKNLKELLSASTSQDLMWEIPKGRKDQYSSETDLSCAIRELCEETELGSDRFYIIPNQTVEMRFSNRKAQYISKFYIAVALDGSNTLDRRFRRWNPKVLIHDEVLSPLLVKEVDTKEKKEKKESKESKEKKDDPRFPSDPRLNFANHHQLLEVIDVRWVGLEELKFLDQSKRFYTTVNNIFKMLRSRYRIPKLTELDLLKGLLA